MSQHACMIDERRIGSCADFAHDIISSVVAPILATERGCVYVSEIISFLVSVLASVVGYYICKWLDGDDSDN